ncbi:MAG: hypothetical protein WD069_20035 [Planctomycetales bacterium]
MINIRRECIEVHRDPIDGHYSSLRTFEGDEELSPLCRPQATLRPCDLFTSD